MVQEYVTQYKTLRRNTFYLGIELKQHYNETMSEIRMTWIRNRKKTYIQDVPW